MGTPEELLMTCCKLGAEFSPLPGNKVKVRAIAALPQELQDELRSRKSEVLAVLNQPIGWPLPLTIQDLINSPYEAVVVTKGLPPSARELREVQSAEVEWRGQRCTMTVGCNQQYHYYWIFLDDIGGLRRYWSRQPRLCDCVKDHVSIYWQ